MAKNNLNRFVSLEISEECIVAVELQFQNGVVNLLNGFRIDVPVFNDINATVNLIKQNLKSSNIKTKDVVVGLSMQYFKLFPIPIPTTIPEQEINLIISQEGNVDLQNEIVSNFPLKNTQRQEQDGVNRFDVLGISIQKSLIDSVSNIIKKSGLNLYSLTPSFLGLSPFLSGQNNALSATLWVSKSRSEVVVWSGIEPIYENLILSSEINEQVPQTINFIQNQIPGASITNVFTSGPSIYDFDLSQVPYNLKAFSLTQDVSDSGNVVKKLSVGEVITPIGLALCAAGLSPVKTPNVLDSMSSSAFSKTPGVAKQKVRGGLGSYIPLAVFIFLIALASGIFVKTALLPNVLSSSKLSNSKLSLAQSKLNKALKYQSTNKIYSAKVKYLSRLIDKRTPWSKIMKEIADLTPKHLWIDRLEVRNNKVNVSGRSLDVESVANFSINLNYTAKLLKNAQIISLRKYQEDGIDFIEFQVIASVGDNNQSKIYDEKIGSKIESKIEEELEL